MIKRYKFGSPSINKLRGLDPDIKVLAVSDDGSRIDISTDGADEADVDALMAELGYSTDVYPRYRFLGSTPLVETHPQLEITQDSDWQLVGSVTTDAGSPVFGSDRKKALGRVTCTLRTDGDGCAFRVTQDDLVKVLEMTPQGGVGVSDTARNWKFMNFETIVPPEQGDRLYRVEAKRGGAASFFIKAASLSMLEINPLPAADE